MVLGSCRGAFLERVFRVVVVFIVIDFVLLFFDFFLVLLQVLTILLAFLRITALFVLGVEWLPVLLACLLPGQFLNLLLGKLLS